MAPESGDGAGLERYTCRPEVGHTPPGPDTLVGRMRARGFTAEELIDAGLGAIDTNGVLRDFYRQRVLVPVRDAEGRVAGLIGRNVGDPRWPKYKNPPRTVAYDKSVNLYQPLPAPGALSTGRVAVVEGTIDAMAIAVAAIEVGRASAFLPRHPIRARALAVSARSCARPRRWPAGHRL